MAIVTASASTGTGVPISNSVRTQYQSEYEQEVYFSRFYDQLAIPMAGDMARLIEGSSVQVNFLSKMDLGTSAISEVTDVTPQALKDATTSVTPTSRGEVIQISQQSEIQNFLQNYMSKLTKMVAENAAESIDVLAREAALKGSMVSRSAARASLDAASTAHRMTENKFMNAASTLADLKAPMFQGVGDGEGGSGAWGAFMDPFVFGDLRQDGSIKAVGEYQQAGIHLNWELGRIGPFRLLVNSWAKIFYGAGADQPIIVATTLGTSTTKLAKTITVAAITHFANVESANAWINIGTEETGSTHYQDNERVKTAGYTGSTVTIVGQAPNGGLRFSHAAGTAVRNADSVHTVVFGGPGSLVKLYAPEVGEFGEIVGPMRSGNLNQFWNLGWKYWGGYGRVAENRLLREEVSVSDESVHATS
jgi:N4-gp56 family major capsid protein